MESKGGRGNARGSLKSGSAQKESKRSASRESPKRSPSAASPSQKSAKRASQAATASKANRTSLSSQRGMGGPGRSPVREERSGSGVSAAVSAPSPVTADALASINYAAFSQGSLNAKQRRARMLKDFLAAHGSGAQLIKEEWAEEREALWSRYLQASHAPQSREIQRLMTLTKQIEASCQQRLRHANAVSRCALGGIEELLTRLTESGLSISADTRVLSNEPDPILANGGDGEDGQAADELGQQQDQQQRVEKGVPLAEVRGFDPSKPDPHPPAFRVSEAERDEVARLKGVFERAIDSIMAREPHNNYTGEGSSFSGLPEPPTTGTLTKQSTLAFPALDGTGVSAAAATTTDVDALHAESTLHTELSALSAHPTSADEERLRQVDELHRELGAVGEAFVALMKRVEAQQRGYKTKITAQRAALDAAATRTKLADDVLRGTVDQGEAEACSAVAEVQQLSLELRRRMEVSEVAMQSALDALVKESAEVCVANDALHDYAALTLNRDNCLYAYMSRMERQVVEQASVLREAQDTVTRLWSRLHTPAQQLQQQERQQSAASRSSDKKTGPPQPPTATKANASAGGAIAFPPLYQELLRHSDRDTLLNLAEQLSQHSTEVAAVVVRVLDEQQARNALHPAKAAAAREAHQRTVATQQLLEKLDAEGYLRSNERQTTLPLSERIAHLVAQYDAYIDFNVQYARALVRQADVERREQAPSQFAFFDTRTPTPALKGVAAGAAGSATATGAASATPHTNKPPNTSTVPRTYAGIFSSPAAAATKPKGAPVTTTPDTSLPYLQLWEAKQRETQQRQRGLAAAATSLSGVDFAAQNPVNNGRIIHYLERSSAQASLTHDLVPSPPRTSIPGSNSSTSNGGAFGLSGSSATVLGASGSALRGRRHTAVGATATTCESTTPPPPPVPPRAGLTSYVMSTYAGKGTDSDREADAARQSLASSRPSVTRALPYRDGDRQFIERQREVFQQLD